MVGGGSVEGRGLLTQPSVRSRAEGQALAQLLKKNSVSDRHSSSFPFTNVPSDNQPPPPGFSPGRGTLTHSVFTAARGPVCSIYTHNWGEERQISVRIQEAQAFTGVPVSLKPTNRINLR